MNFENLKQFLDSLSSTYGIPGASCRVWHNHKEVFRHDVGIRDIETGEAMRGNEQFDVYSASKPVTAVACMQLIEKGWLSPRDPISRYFPSYAKVMQIDEAGWPHPLKKPITLAHALSMTSGFQYTMNTPAVKKMLADMADTATTAEFVEAMADQPVYFEPGTHWCYNIGLDIAAGVVEKVSDMPFDEYVKKYIFDPLGMTSSCYFTDQADPERYMYTYDMKNGQFVKRYTNAFRVAKKFVSGGASLISTADDYVRFTDALACGGVGYTGNRILLPCTIDMMRQNRLTPKMRDEIPWDQCKGYGYGLGVRTLVDPAEAGALSPVGEFGWDGLKGAYLVIDPEHELSLFYVEQTGMHKEYLHPRLRNLMYIGMASESK